MNNSTFGIENDQKLSLKRVLLSSRQILHTPVAENEHLHWYS